MKRSTLVYTGLIVALTIVFMGFNGCESLRKSPTEAQKQTAQMGLDATSRIRQSGTSPGSPTSVIAHESARANQIYFGLPKGPLAAPEVVIPAAQADAAKRPDPWETIDTALALGLAVAGIFGGAGSIKVIKFITVAQAKSKALREIIKAQQKFRDELKLQADSDETGKAAELLKSLKAHNDDAQSPETMTLVTEVKAKVKKGQAA